MRGPIIAALFTAAVGVSSCAVYDDFAYGRAYGYHGHRYGDYRYDGSRFSGWSRSTDSFTGAGATLLDPWLVQTSEGRAVVRVTFDEGRPGHISADTAHRANAWFRRYADRDHNLSLSDEEIRMALVQARSRRS
nr:hypothetical protein [uncultured Sphingosinicella sp.]